MHTETSLSRQEEGSGRTEKRGFGGVDGDQERQKHGISLCCLQPRVYPVTVTG